MSSNSVTYSNPFTYSDRSFTFDPVKTENLYYISVSLREGNYIHVSVIVPACTKQRAMLLFKKALEFRLECGKDSSYGRYGCQVAQGILDVIDKKGNEYDLCIKKVVPNQFFKVGWACNDTVL